MDYLPDILTILGHFYSFRTGSLHAACGASYVYDMAKLLSGIQFTGSLSQLTAYRMRGVEGVVVRTKGGATRQQMKTSPSFEHVRRNNAEFGGRATASKWIMNMLRPHKALADHNIAGPLNALLKPIQALDTVSEWGKRNVQISQHKHLLEGFSLNHRHTVDSVLRSLSFSISRTEGTARVDIPSLLPNLNFFPTGSHAFYRISAVLGIVPDLFYQNGSYEPASPIYAEARWVMKTTPWRSTRDRAESIALNLVGAMVPPDEFSSLMLSVGIGYGAVTNVSTIEAVKYAGSAKVLALT